MSHGKTTLAAAILKVKADPGSAVAKTFDQINNAPQEKQDGVIISASRVKYDTASYNVGHIDCVSHIDFVKGLLAGMLHLNGAILVVDASKGQEKETEDQIRIASEVGLPIPMVFLNKVDKVNDAELQELVELEIDELLTKHGYNSTPIVSGSALAALEGRDDAIGKKAIESLLEGIELIDQGQVRSKSGSVGSHSKFSANIYVLSKNEGGRHAPFFNQYRPQFSFPTAGTTGSVNLHSGTEMAMPGDILSIDVSLLRPIAMEKGQRFTILEGGRTVGVGVVSKIIR